MCEYMRKILLLTLNKTARTDDLLSFAFIQKIHTLSDHVCWLCNQTGEIIQNGCQRMLISSLLASMMNYGKLLMTRLSPLFMSSKF